MFVDWTTGNFRPKAAIWSSKLEGKGAPWTFKGQTIDWIGAFKIVDGQPEEAFDWQGEPF